MLWSGSHDGVVEHGGKKEGAIRNTADKTCDRQQKYMPKNQRKEERLHTTVLMKHSPASSVRSNRSLLLRKLLKLHSRSFGSFFPAEGEVINPQED